MHRGRLAAAPGPAGRLTPDVSVLLPFRDVRATLAEALGSVLDEGGPRIEVLAIDDGSTDGSGALAARFDPRVRWVRSTGRGIALALELGRSLARAPFLCRMDGDDVSLPGRIAAQAEALERDPGLAVVGGRVEALGDVGEGLVRYVAWQNALITPAEHLRDRFVEATLCHPSTMLRASALAAVSGFRDGDFAEDWDLWLRLHAAGFALAKIERTVLRWRHRAGRATFADPRYGVDAHRRLRARHLAPVLHAARRPLAMWGAGPVARRLARALEPHGVRFERFVEIDPRRIGGVCRGAPIVAPEGLLPGDFVVVAVGARGARDEIRAHLVHRGRVELEDFVCAA